MIKINKILELLKLLKFELTRNEYHNFVQYKKYKYVIYCIQNEWIFDIIHSDNIHYSTIISTLDNTLFYDFLIVYFKIELRKIKICKLLQTN